MKTNLLYKRLSMKTALFLFFIMASGEVVISQNMFSLDFSDTTTYKVTCGKVNASQWTVKNDSCIMYTPYFRKETEGCKKLSYDLTINQSGNGDGNDRIWMQYQINNGVWLSDTVLNASIYAAVHHLIDSIPFCFSQVIRFRIIMLTNDNSEFWSIKNGDIDLNGSFIKYSNFPGDALPVELTSYKIKCTNTGSLFSWTTASETNNDFFTIEKTEDMLNWKIITTISGAFNSNQEIQYSSIDTTMVPDKTIYYRLKQTDVDGQYKYFDVLAILCSFSNDELEIIGVNVSENHVNLIVKTDGLQPLSVLLTDMSGKSLAKTDFTPKKGANIISIEATSLPSGIYIASIIQNNNKSVKKIMLGQK